MKIGGLARREPRSPSPQDGRGQRRGLLGVEDGESIPTAQIGLSGVVAAVRRQLPFFGRAAATGPVVPDQSLLASPALVPDRSLVRGPGPVVRVRGPVVHVVPAGVVSLVLPAGPPVLEIRDPADLQAAVTRAGPATLEIRGGPDLESLDLTAAGPVDRLRLVGCPRLSLVQLRRDQPTLLSVDRPSGAVPLRLNGLVCLAEATLGEEVIGLSQGPKSRRFCRDAYIGSAEKVPVDVELLACIGPDSLAAVAVHRAASVRLAVADREWATFRLQGTVDILALVLIQACPRLALVMVTPDVLCVSVQRCNALNRLLGSGFSAQIVDCHPTPRAGHGGALNIGGPWREASLTNVGYTHVDGISERFVVNEAPALELITNGTDCDVVVNGDCGRIVAGPQAAYPERLVQAVRVGVGLHPTLPSHDGREFARLPNAKSVQLALVGLAALLSERPKLDAVWRVRCVLLARVHEVTGRDPTCYPPDQDPKASWPCRNTTGADEAWQADLALVEACQILPLRRLGAAQPSMAPPGGAAVGQSGGDACISTLGNMRHIWLVRMIAQARAERVASGRDHAWADEALVIIFGSGVDLEPAHGITRFVPAVPGIAASAVEDGPAIVDHLLAARAAEGGEAMIDQCVGWLHNGGRRKGGLEMLGRLARAGNAAALRALAEIPGGGGLWLPEDRGRALQLVLGAVRPVSP